MKRTLLETAGKGREDGPQDVLEKVEKIRAFRTERKALKNRLFEKVEEKAGKSKAFGRMGRR